MKLLSIYISLLFFIAFLAAPSIAAMIDFKVKEEKVAKLFDLEEEEDARDTDPENEKTEKEKTSEKFFRSFLASVTLPVLGTATLIHYTLFQCPISDPIKELITPPPRT